MIQIILIIDPMPNEDAKVFIVIQEMHIRKYQRKTNWFGLYLPHSDSVQLQAMLILHLQYPSWDKLWVWWTIWSRLRVWWSLFYPLSSVQNLVDNGSLLSSFGPAISTIIHPGQDAYPAW